MIYAVICIVGTLEAASIKVVKSTDTAVTKLDYEEVQQNVRGSRQANGEDASGEDSDEDDDEDDAELLQQQNIRQQQAQEQAVNDSQEGSDEDDEDDNEENDDDDDDDNSFFGRRLKRDVAEPELTNEIVENTKPIIEEIKEKEPSEESLTVTDATTAAPSASATPNTSVLILIRDAIKKVTELPNTQQVATSAQQYFQFFEHFLQQTIEQVIGDDDDEDEVESTTIAPESSASVDDKVLETIDKVSETSDKVPETSESTDKQTIAAVVSEVPVAEHKPETVVSTQVDATKA